MKIKIYLITAITLLFVCPAIAQDSIPNHHFERWDTTGTWEEPKLWTSLNSFTQGFGAVGVSQFQYPGSGSYQVSIKTLNFFGTTIPGLLINGDFTFSMSDTAQIPLLGGTPYITMEQKLYGLYNYVVTDSTDSASITVVLKRWNSSTQQTEAVAMGNVHLPQTSPGMHAFEIDINQLSAYNPDSVVITMVSTNEDNFQDGGELLVDFVSFDKPTSVKAIENNLSVTVYPNPANDYIFISADENFSYTITDISGKTVMAGESIASGTSVGISQLTTGVYFIQINGNTGNGTGVSRFVKQ